MPWQPADATKHTKKAKKPKQKAQWAKIADRLLSSGVPEGQAIREANGVVKRRSK